jgi:hypothetical protein
MVRFEQQQAFIISNVHQKQQHSIKAHHQRENEFQQHHINKHGPEQSCNHQTATNKTKFMQNLGKTEFQLQGVIIIMFNRA